MKIYISIPITGHPMKRVRQQADLIKAAISRKGHIPVSPLEIDAGHDPSYEDHMAADISEMLRCDAVYFAPGWGLSIGCCIEHEIVRGINRRRELSGRKKIKIIYPCFEGHRTGRRKATPLTADEIISELSKEITDVPFN